MTKELTFLGYGGPFNYNQDNTSAYYQLNNTLLLIDCGEKIASKIICRNLLNAISNIIIVITHLHSDHVASLEPLLTYINIFKKEISIVVIYPQKELLLSLLKDFNFNFKVNIIDSLHSEDIDIDAKKAHHFENSYSYFIRISDFKFYYSGDTSEIDNDAVKYLLTNKIDLIYHEVCINESNIHTSLSKLNNTFVKKHRNKIYLMHFENNEVIKLAKKNGYKIPKLKK